MEKIIHFTVPKKITPIQAEIIEQARSLHPAWEIKVWQDPVQSGSYLLEKYWSKANSGAQRADLIRLDVIYKWGGVYVDGDLRLLKPLDALTETYDVFFASAFGDNLEGALFGARKAHPAIRSVIDDLLLNEPDWSVRADRTTGPDLFARMARWNRDVTILPRETFYTYSPDETHARKIHRHSYGEHLWEVSWGAFIDKPPNRPIGGKDNAKRLLWSLISAGFETSHKIKRTWHRIKAIDPKAKPKRKPRSYPTQGEIVVRTPHGFNVIVDGSDIDRTPKIIFGDETDLRDEITVKDILRGGDWVIDVGSKAASFCMLAAQRVGSFGRVFAYQNDRTIADLIGRSSVLNRMHDRVIVRPAAIETPKQASGSGPDVPGADLDKEFPVDLPIKFLNIDVECDAAAVLKGARRLLEHRCIDFIQIGVFKEPILGWQWRRELGGTRLSELMTQLKTLLEAGYVVCTISKGGTLVEHKSVTTALDGIEGRNIILRARDQYTPTVTSLDC